ncbi:MAG: anthranilate synthase component II [Beijerinckiaceae bacterium]|jgi:anthranilate synthase component 2
MNITLIDNYDSFTYNLYHDLGRLEANVTVVRNDALTVAELAASNPDAIVLSPGPCTPTEAGICLDVIKTLGNRIPIFGVCLGMQAIGQAFGGDVVRAPQPFHGKISEIQHSGQTLFRGINQSFKATRYHSLIVERSTLPQGLDITAQTDDGLIMALSHKTLPMHAVQFHPESVLSEHGLTIFANFLDLAALWNAQHIRTPLAL